MERWFKMKVLKQEDPFLKIGESNDRTSKGNSDIVYSLRDINFDINQGDAVGIIGRNGAGKSTLLKILSRVTTPTTGRINIKGRVASLLEVGSGFHPELTGRENIYLNGAILGMRKREIDRKLDEIIDFSGVERYIDTPVKRYSSGMYVRLAFAVAAHLESEILIVDEVLAVGDAEFQKKCLGKMGEVSKGEGRTVLFVSHNMAAVDKFCNTGIFLEDGKIASQGLIKSVLGNYKKTLHGNLFQKDSGFLREVLINQKDDKIVIQGIFESEFDIKGPSLGFVVSEIDGTKLFGSNPYLNIKEGQEIPIIRSGRIECIIEEPKLLNGNYLLSVWFGDEKNDFESFEDVIQFEIINMTPVFTRYFNKNDTGSIYTKSQFNFYKD